jgi:hypothetical protein
MDAPKNRPSNSQALLFDSGWPVVCSAEVQSLRGLFHVSQDFGRPGSIGPILLI